MTGDIADLKTVGRVLFYDVGVARRKRSENLLVFFVRFVDLRGFVVKRCG